MSDQDVDDIAFLTGENTAGTHKQNFYGHNGVAVCSQRRALVIAVVAFAFLLGIAVIIAYAGIRCPCAGKRPDNLDYDYDDSGPLIPVATNNEIFPWNNVRLPDTLSPMRYRIHIHPNLTTLAVKGQVTIEFNVKKETNFIVLHSRNITILDRTVVDGKGDELEIEKFLEYTVAQQIYIELKEYLQVGLNYSLNIRYNTQLGKELEGFYISSYVNQKGERRYLATTHFEPTYARSAFPCFDEPQFKARFKMSIVRDRFHIALFNMPVVNTEDAGFYMGTGLLLDDFEESVEMSTYLVAFVVCDYNHTTSQTKRGISVSVYAPTQLISQAKFALETATTMMDHYEEFFGVEYPLPKQDLIAIPDFAAGAMENWGLITYRETSILYDPIETSAIAHQWVAIVIAHELAHQWFGNLVTMKWWNDLWLNEGFASFLEYTGVDHVMPGWKMMDQFILVKTQPALDLDALATSHPISVDVHNPTEIEAIFDTISYSKGAAILYMLEKFLEEDTLRSGLNDYLNTHMFKNADTEDLWFAFSKHNNQSLQVKTVMDTWTKQMGFPVIMIYHEDNTVHASQSRFLLTATMNNNSFINEPASVYDYKWYVPLSYYTNVDTSDVRHVWMNLTDVTFEVPENIIWIKANVNQSGFYRVNYEEDMWMAIIDALKKNPSVFSPADRASLIDDAFTLCRQVVLDHLNKGDFSNSLIQSD
ncbi:hypothetical protein RUM44_001107 [Polyplax serrata]|uniref:Aminopeptidase n=1 Tax=Polyplax serrata TaxID=468196 RepID=A0ABR1B6N5_POLSC